MHIISHEIDSGKDLLLTATTRVPNYLSHCCLNCEGV